MSELEGRVRSEVEQLHAFFEGWLGGTLDPTRAVFERLERALDPQFAMVVPSGDELSREALIESLFEGHGKQPGLSIRIEACRVLWSDASSGVCLVRYEEVQAKQPSAPATRRISTALLRVRKLAGELVWLHVHETWNRVS